MSFAQSKFLGSIRITENVLKEDQGKHAGSPGRTCGFSGEKKGENAPNDRRDTISSRQGLCSFKGDPQGKEFVASKGRSLIWRYLG